MVSDEKKKEYIEETKVSIERELTRPELPILNIGMPADSEGKTSFSPGTGWMNGKIEDILRKVFPLTGRMMGVRIVSLSIYTTDQLARMWWEYSSLANIEYVPPQEEIGKEVIVAISSREGKVKEFVELLDSETKYEIDLEFPEFPRILVKI